MWKSLVLYEGQHVTSTQMSQVSGDTHGQRIVGQSTGSDAIDQGSFP